jgi:hypothetical protein
MTALPTLTSWADGCRFAAFPLGRFRPAVPRSLPSLRLGLGLGLVPGAAFWDSTPTPSVGAQLPWCPRALPLRLA